MTAEPRPSILATDSGQVNTPFWRDAIRESIAYYQSAGVSKDELETMLVTNPGKMLGLPSQKA